MHERHAKIVATIGPASASEDVLAALLNAGMDIVRLNLSHGSHDDHRRVIRRVRRIAAAQGRFVPIIADLMGPRYRLGPLPSVRMLEEGETIRLGGAAASTDLPVEDSAFLSHVRRGERLLIDNGLVELAVRAKRGDRITTQVVTGGPVSTRKGINLPDTNLPFTISDKDRADIHFAVAEGADYIAVSFVGGPEDLEAIRAVVKEAGGVLPLIAKLERAKVIARLEETVRAADAVMVARGDLGVEVPLHEVPVLQKQIIAAGRRRGKPVIVATQMLESMMEHPRPTRAETSDVANAVFDGADALMLSGETAAGSHPVQVVGTMVKIIAQAEDYRPPLSLPRDDESRAAVMDELFRPLLPGLAERMLLNAARDIHFEIPDTIAAAAVHAAGRLDARQIVAFSQSGFSARMIARYRPQTAILVFTNDARTARRIQLIWGVRPQMVDESVEHHDEVVSVVDRLLLEGGHAAAGDCIIILMGDPIAERPLTNLMRIHRVRPQ